MEQIEAMGVSGLAGGLMKAVGGKGELPSSGALKMARMVSYIYLLIALFGMVALFLKHAKIGMIAIGALALFGIVMWLIQPSIDGGSHGPADPAKVALVLMIMSLIGAGCIYGIHNANKKVA
ncbi:MAG TPA: hypothetical protein ENJ82_05705 [Bacteroidetes bacterium]|nr:hypothetical protein [Bacteroidota bacterium]